MKTFATRAWQFCWAPLVDHYDGISITRALALFYAFVCWRTVELKTSIGLNVLWLALATIAAAFGKSTFTFLLKRLQYAGTRSETDVHVDATVKQIEERRGSADFEAAP